jgi:hypothetical protein
MAKVNWIEVDGGLRLILVGNKEQLKQIKPLVEIFVPLFVNLMEKSDQTPNNNPSNNDPSISNDPSMSNDQSMSDLAMMLKNVINQQDLAKKDLKKIGSGMKKALEKDGINGALEYLGKKLQADVDPNSQ